jgi:hypothetical protein
MLLLEPNANVVSSAAVNPGNTTTAYAFDPAMQRRVVLVAGHDFPPNQHGVKFVNICKSRVERYLKRGAAVQKNPNWSFTIFDVPAGEVLVNEFDPVAGKRGWKVKRRFAKVTDSNYSDDPDPLTGVRFNRNTAGVMSITDVYEHVRDLGITQPGSLVELSVFSHGWMGGPVLVNSQDPESSTARSPGDKDGRMQKDFVAPNMDAAALSDFRSAFHVNGFIWVWGCAFAIPYNLVINTTVTSASFNSAQGIADTDTLTFSFTAPDAELYFDHDKTFFPARDAVTGKFPLSFTRSFQEVKEYCKRGMKNTYTQKIAKAAARKANGAAPGTYADYERGVSQALMVVPTRKPPHKDDFTRYLKFYRKYLDAKFDPESRGYVEFTP